MAVLKCAAHSKGQMSLMNASANLIDSSTIFFLFLNICPYSNMVTPCCVVGWISKQGKDNVAFYHLPKCFESKQKNIMCETDANTSKHQIQKDSYIYTLSKVGIKLCSLQFRPCTTHDVQSHTSCFTAVFTFLCIIVFVRNHFGSKMHNGHNYQFKYQLS